MHVIATAGHVDHGKSALVLSLSGINPDRLIEEQKREMTIDLGFAWLTLPNGQELGIIDVPGHRDFIENMVAGVGGIDAVLLVIAADEGVMPQTLEHLNILNLLEKKNGIIVLSKVDLISDPGWLEYVESEIRKSLANSVLYSAPIVRVSSKTGFGIVELLQRITELLSEIPTKQDHHQPRLPVDRVFSLAGFGTIVTGTLLDGSFKVGDQVVLQPSGALCRIRGLQTHKRKEQIALPGSRTAVNLSGINTDQISRGDVLTLPQQYLPTRRVDATVRMLENNSIKLVHDDKVKFFIGASERIARVRVLMDGVIKPAESGWVQIETGEAFIAEKGDRFIIRRLSPAETIGGGEIMDGHPISRYKLKDEENVNRLKRRMALSPHNQILIFLEDGEPHTIQDMLQKSQMDDLESIVNVERLIREKKAILLFGEEKKLLPSSMILSIKSWEDTDLKNTKLLQDYHLRFPIRLGIPIEEWKTKLGLAGQKGGRIADRLLQEGKIALSENHIHLATHAIHYSIAQEKNISRLWNMFQADRFNPPSLNSCHEIGGEELIASLIETGQLIRVSGDIVFRLPEFNQMLEYVIETIRDQGILAVAGFRDHFKTSRKFSLVFLEYLDRKGVTAREGEGRVLTGKEWIC
ncbi:MAG: selenocysteine-specific translation elongation factor [Chloroflexi bacterium]|nr:selenocysteine-specific translation elongation factor [Chloroflexota bacterium]